MSKSFRFGTAAGIPLFVHWTFLLIPAYLILGGLASGRTSLGLLADVTFVTVIFSCVVLHELGHALAARHFGVQTQDIILMPIGGVARLERMPKRPVEELLVALAGPAVNVGIASVLLMVTLPTIGIHGLLNPMSFAASLAGKAIAVNLAMIVFNMLPAFPLDGGRVLRALLSSGMGHLRATRIAARVGQIMAILFGLAGLFVLHNPMLIFIAGFVFLGAAQEAGAAEAEASLEDLHVGNVMITHFETIPAQASVTWALRFAMSANKRELTVVSSGQFLGIAKIEDLANAVANGHSELSVGSFCHRRVRRIRVTDPLTRAASALQASEFQALPVIDSEGHLAGLVTRESILAGVRFGALVNTLSASPLRERPDELRHHLTRMQIG